MKVALYVDHWDSRGAAAERWADALVRSLIDRGCRVQIWCHSTTSPAQGPAPLWIWPGPTRCMSWQHRRIAAARWGQAQLQHAGADLTISLNPLCAAQLVICLHGLAMQLLEHQRDVVPASHWADLARIAATRYDATFAAIAARQRDALNSPHVRAIAVTDARVADWLKRRWGVDPDMLWVADLWPPPTPRDDEARRSIRRRLRSAWTIPDDAVVLTLLTGDPWADGVDAALHALAQLVRDQTDVPATPSHSDRQTPSRRTPNRRQPSTSTRVGRATSSASAEQTDSPCRPMLALAGEIGWAQQKLAARLSVRDHVRIIATTRQMDSLLAMSDVLLFPTRANAWADGLRMAMQAGLPVISSDRHGAMRWLEPSAHDVSTAPVHEQPPESPGWVVPWHATDPANHQPFPQRLADAMRSALDDDARARRGAAAREVAARIEHDPAGQILALLDTLARKPAMF